MITGERSICVNIRLLVKSYTQIEEVISHIRQDFYSVIQHHIDEYNEIENGEITLYLVSPQKCPHCHNIYTECLCGKPFARPAV